MKNNNNELDKIWNEFIKPINEKTLYGKYKKPKTLSDLEELSNKNLIELENIGFFLDKSIPYSPQPIDMIPFATTGVDGTFFAFLTDFGTVDNLNKAPIVMYCSADINLKDSTGYFLFAENILDFLSICIQIGCPGIPYDGNPKEINFEEKKLDYFEFEEDEEKENRLRTINKIKSFFKLKKIKNLNKYYEKFYAERTSKVNIKTKDGLGVAFNDSMNNNLLIKPLNIILNKNGLELFLKNLNYVSRVQFYRNYGYIYKDIHKKGFLYVIELLIKFLKKDGFNRESENLNIYLSKQKNYFLFHQLKE